MNKSIPVMIIFSLLKNHNVPGGHSRKDGDGRQRKMPCSCERWDDGWGRNSLWTQMRQCNELPGFDTVFPILLMHSAVDIFPACLASLPPFLLSSPGLVSVSLSLFQPIRHDSTSWLLANSQPEDISCVCVCVWVGEGVNISVFEGVCPYF